MDMEQKDMYETYEFLPGSSTEPETEQFLVVENNGTFLLNMNKDVQYISDIQDVNKVLETVQSCAVYDEATQQYYVNVENASQLITVSDQFIIPNSESNDVYANNYLLQPTSEESSTEVIESKPDSNETKEEYAELVIQETNNMAQAPESSLTEITLNDDQWKMLEEKGWVILEFNDKIFLLNTLGLHDITDNQKMIEKFRNEIAVVFQNSTAETCGEQKESNSLLLTEAVPSVAILENNPQIDVNMGCLKVEYTNESSPQISNDQSPKFLPPLTPRPATARSLLKPVVASAHAPTAPTSLLKPQKPKSVIKVTKQKPKRYGRFLRIETALKAEDIPQKIVLGKTLSGKNLVAKVIGVQAGDVNTDNADIPKTPSECEPPAEMERLFRVWAAGGQPPCGTGHVARAERLVRRLLAAPAACEPLRAANLLVTMVETTVDKNNVSRVGPPVFVTGRAAAAAAAAGPAFVHEPQMLQKILDNNIEETGQAVLQLHAAERRDARAPLAPPAVAVTFAMRHLPIQVLSKRIPALHACAGCAECFDYEEDLLDHHKECSFAKEQSSRTETNVKTPVDRKETHPVRKRETMVCHFCSASVKTQNYKRHLRCHALPDGQKDAPFKCSMCPSTYFYSSTLSKHIMRQHIEVKINNV